MAVPTLTDAGPGGKKRLAQIKDYEETRALPTGFPTHWTNPDVRGALVAMQGKVCAFCGADLEEAAIDVEHFRPKGALRGDTAHGGYWWLAYEFSNYLLSCTICNQKLKSNRFPVRAGAPRVTYENRHQVADEARTLLDPTIDPIEEWLEFDWQRLPGRMRPKEGLQQELAERVDDVLEFFRINKKAAQQKKRWQLQKDTLEKLAEEKAHEVTNLAIRYRPHSLVSKQLLSANAPTALPTPAQELEWLLDSLTSELLIKLEHLNDPTHTDTDEAEAKELLWAFAVLWKDPPAADSKFVQDFLAKRGLKDAVAEYVAKLTSDEITT